MEIHISFLQCNGNGVFFFLFLETIEKEYLLNILEENVKLKSNKTKSLSQCMSHPVTVSGLIFHESKQK